MSKLVTTPKEVTDNVMSFEAEVDQSYGLQDRLSQARAWYACQDDQKVWHFGPSKFVGYQNMTAREYLDGSPRDGRRTEKQLRGWFVELDEEDPLFDTLNGQLHSFLDGYLKVPSALARIMVPKNTSGGRSAKQGKSLPDDEGVTELVIAVARNLPKADRDRIRAAIR